MRIVIIGAGTEYQRIVAEQADVQVLLVDHDSGEAVQVTAEHDPERVQSTYREAAPAALAEDVPGRLVLERDRGGVVHLIADAAGAEVLVVDGDGFGVPMWVGAVDPARVDTLFEVLTAKTDQG